MTAIRHLIRSWWAGLHWRHHGIGVLQAYLIEDDDPEVRVHVWDPRLVRPGIRDSGDIHDHRFDLESEILYGTLKEVIYHSPHGHTGLLPGPWQIWSVENARSAGEAKGFDGECKLISPATFAANEQHRTHPQGSSYRLDRGVFHRTLVDSMAITVCTMSSKIGQARLLVPTGKEPVHAFGSPTPAWRQAEILREAYEALR